MARINATLEKKDKIADDTYELTFALGGAQLAFQPAQYVWIILTNLKYEDARGERRAFSITSSSTDAKHISILFRQGVSGYKRTLLEYDIGEHVIIDGAYGSSFALDTNKNKSIIMISGGVGIAPFLGIIRSQPLLTGSTEFTLINFNSSKETQFLNEELAKLCKDRSIKFSNIIGEATIKDHLDLKKLKNSVFYVCGPQAMVDSIYNQLLVYHVKIDQIIFEEVYPSLKGALDL